MNAKSTSSTPMVDTNYEPQFFDWLKKFFKGQELQFSQCGFKTNVGVGQSHEYNTKTGYWKNENHSRNKPPRWLYHIIPTDNGLTAKNPVNGNITIGAINSAQEDKAGAVFRLVPFISQTPNDFIQDDSIEVHALFIFNGPTPKGSSAEHFVFDPTTGELKFKKNPLEYICCGLLGIKSRNTEITIDRHGLDDTITYGEIVDALAANIKFSLDGQSTSNFVTFDLTDKVQYENLKNMVENSWKTRNMKKSKHNSTMTAGSSNAGVTASTSSLVDIPKCPSLIGIDSSVYRQINAALKSGKQHIMLYGPPGTGKTTIARWIAKRLPGGNSTLMTGSSDWSSQDIIGGYQPIGTGDIAFIPGVLLKNFDDPLIIDELNRCDIDKVLGPLFTVLSGHQTTLPYRCDIGNKNSLQYTILPDAKTSLKSHEFAPGPNWRLIATINSIDKAALYQMSYALSRRFGWIYIDAPENKAEFISSYLSKSNPALTKQVNTKICPLGNFWERTNRHVRALGPAPFIDAIKIIQEMDKSANFFELPSQSMKDALLNALDMVLLPLLDGIVAPEATRLSETMIQEFGLEKPEDKERIARRMKAITV